MTDRSISDETDVLNSMKSFRVINFLFWKTRDTNFSIYFWFSTLVSWSLNVLTQILECASLGEIEAGLFESLLDLVDWVFDECGLSDRPSPSERTCLKG
jgi:hypothetical protein